MPWDLILVLGACAPVAAFFRLGLAATFALGFAATAVASRVVGL